MKSISIGYEENPSFTINVIAYERNPVGCTYDDNWLHAEIKFSIGAFSGAYSLDLLAHDFPPFLIELESLHNSLIGTASFSTLEGQIEFKLQGNGRGKVEVDGRLSDRPGDGNELRFIFEIDQTYLPKAIHELREICSEFVPRKA